MADRCPDRRPGGGRPSHQSLFPAGARTVVSVAQGRVWLELRATRFYLECDVRGVRHWPGGGRFCGRPVWPADDTDGRAGVPCHRRGIVRGQPQLCGFSARRGVRRFRQLRVSSGRFLVHQSSCQRAAARACLFGAWRVGQSRLGLCAAVPGRHCDTFRCWCGSLASCWTRRRRTRHHHRARRLRPKNRCLRL